MPVHPLEWSVHCATARLSACVARCRQNTYHQNGNLVSVDLDSLPVTLTDIERAAELLEGVIERTPVAHSRALSQRLGSEVFFKCENLQRAGSFKVRGAYVRMAKLSEEEKKRGVVAASAGNHAQGVALAADRLGIKARIYMPLGAALPKITATRDHGAEVELHGVTVDEALAEAKRYADETGAVFVHPFDNEDIIAGQGTIGLEILEQVPDVDTVIVGVGGGGLLAGLSAAIRAKEQKLGKKIKIIGVQAEHAAAYPLSLAADALVPLKKVSTIADGIAVGRPGQMPFSIIKELVDDVATVSEDDIARALIFLMERNKLVVEPAGSVPVAIQRGLSAAGRYMTVKMMLSDRPGELATISRIISENDANVTGVDHTRVGGSLSMGDVSITIDMETKGVEHCRQVISALEDEGFKPIIVY